MHRAGRPVVFVKQVLRPDHGDAILPPGWKRLGLDAASGFLAEGSWGAELVDAAGWDQRYAEGRQWSREPNRFFEAAVTGLQRSPGRAIDLACGEGRNALWLATLGWDVTGVDFNETELGRAREAAARAGVKLTLLGQDMRDMEFAAEFDLAVNLFSSIGYFTDDEDRLLLDRFWRALVPGGTFVLDTRNRDQVVRSLPPAGGRLLLR